MRGQVLLGVNKKPSAKKNKAESTGTEFKLERAVALYVLLFFVFNPISGLIMVSLLYVIGEMYPIYRYLVWGKKDEKKEGLYRYKSAFAIIGLLLVFIGLFISFSMLATISHYASMGLSTNISSLSLGSFSLGIVLLGIILIIIGVLVGL